MEAHHNGEMTTEELESLISDHGILFRQFRGDGFLVVGDEHMFIVKDSENESSGFSFSEISKADIQELQATESYPSNRIDFDVEDAERQMNGEDCTAIKVWTPSHSTIFHAAAHPHKVSAALVNFKTQNLDDCCTSCTEENTAD